MPTQSIRKGYLAALLDGEGTVSKAPEKTVVIYSSDPHLILAAAWCATKLGFTSMRVSGSQAGRYKFMWMLCFYQQDSFSKLLQLPLQSKEKVARLNAILVSYKGRQKKTWDRDKALALHQQGVSSWKIAKQCGVDYTTVQHYLRSLGEEHVT